MQTKVTSRYAIVTDRENQVTAAITPSTLNTPEDAKVLQADDLVKLLESMVEASTTFKSDTWELFLGTLTEKEQSVAAEFADKVMVKR